MTATNHTKNYNLSQFAGSDRPTWLGDYNGDMAKIDAQLKQNADDIASATEDGLTTVAHTADLTGYYRQENRYPGRERLRLQVRACGQGR